MVSCLEKRNAHDEGPALSRFQYCLTGNRQNLFHRIKCAYHRGQRLAGAPFVNELQKSLAQNKPWREARNAMSTSGRSTNRGRALVAGFISVAFLWALALSVSPQLHQRFHPDANRVEHSCAITMIASGSYNHASHPPLVTLALPIIQFSKIPALTPQRVQSSFLGSRIFEHAPPALG